MFEQPSADLAKWLFLMKRAFFLLFCCALMNQVSAQSYRAKNAMRTREVPVPAKVVKKFKRTYPDARIDSCRVYGDLEKGEEEYMFYSKQQNRVLNVAFDKNCQFAESETEVSIEELPLSLQQTIAKKSFQADSIGKAFKLIGKRRRNEVEYMLEWFINEKGHKLKSFMYFNAAGSLSRASVADSW
ncbi:hypothetical protein [Hymenobacter canadensis]|uniref:Beta-lactamase-inhibitor-like PepSY-like domain-containing protein n=1 Tax=Hymenobacter canadensis TaxID=2999067 RepID=A0ABY7LP18_9BACT|nr:hypothetical protein [Hymenobacter canadensis]WBA42171.1 hypothetical protein O3303_01125 [Hymenobacter canadensis]